MGLGGLEPARRRPHAEGPHAVLFDPTAVHGAENLGAGGSRAIRGSSGGS